MKLTKILIFALLLVLLSGCELLGGSNNKEDDTTIYHTVLEIQGVPEDVISANNYKIEAVTYECDENDVLTPNPTTYNEVDATYQSRVDLKAPFIPGYKFDGWYDDNNKFQGGLGDDNIKDGYDFWWNSYQKNGTFYAKYELWNYTVVYGSFEKDGQNAGANRLEDGYTYNITKGDVVLADGETTNGHETFKEWYYRNPSTGEEVVVDKLPTDYFDEILVIFGKFETEKFKITAEYDHSKGSVEMVDAIFTDGSLNPHVEIVSENEWKTEYGYDEYWVSFKLTPADGIRGAGVTIGEESYGYHYLEDGSESFNFGFRFDQGEDIVIHFEFFE